MVCGCGRGMLGGWAFDGVACFISSRVHAWRGCLSSSAGHHPFSSASFPGACNFLRSPVPLVSARHDCPLARPLPTVLAAGCCCTQVCVVVAVVGACIVRSPSCPSRCLLFFSSADRPTRPLSTVPRSGYALLLPLPLLCVVVHCLREWCGLLAVAFRCRTWARFRCACGRGVTWSAPRRLLSPSSLRALLHTRIAGATVSFAVAAVRRRRVTRRLGNWLGVRDLRPGRHVRTALLRCAVCRSTTVPRRPTPRTLS